MTKIHLLLKAIRQFLYLLQNCNRLKDELSCNSSFNLENKRSLQLQKDTCAYPHFQMKHFFTSFLHLIYMVLNFCSRMKVLPNDMEVN